MNKIICRMALVLAVASLAGCGLKGPLYFPPQEQPKQQTTDSSDQTSATSTDRPSVDSTLPDQNSGTASGTSTNQSSATISSQDGTQSGTSTTEAETPSAQ